MSRKPTIPALGAPTAAGKSAVALELAQRLDLEIISADAMQVYRGMDIGTAKPTAEEQARVPHRVIDVVDPDVSFSVADYVRHAEAAIASVLARGNTPFVVGGTGFYLRALSQGLPTVPPADPGVQEELWNVVRTEGLEALQRELDEASPADASRAQSNPRRVVRAVEILRRTGDPPAAFPYTEPEFELDKVVLIPDMDELHPRIEARTAHMFAAGLVEEVRALLERYPEQPTAMQAIGYKEVLEFLRGGASIDEAKAAVTLATAQYAKRQRTWFRKEPDARRMAALAPAVAGDLAAWLGSYW